MFLQGKRLDPGLATELIGPLCNTFPVPFHSFIYIEWNNLSFTIHCRTFTFRNYVRRINNTAELLEQN